MSTVHVIPIGDHITHLVPGGCIDMTGYDRTVVGRQRWLTLEALPDRAVSDTDCPCGPAVEQVPNDDGPEGWLVTHHSLDGRELTEVQS